jgi:hypothetical protein
MDFCKTKCLDLKIETFSNNEKQCTKNCMLKYLQQYKILDSFKNEYLGFFGINMFLTDDNQVKAMDKFKELINENI